MTPVFRTISYFGFRRFSLLFTFLLSVMFLSSFEITGHEPLEGDKEAIALANKMITSIGGKGIWGDAKSIKVELKGYSAREEYPWDEVFWIELDNAKGWFQIKSKTKDEIIAWTPKGGWHLTDGHLEFQDSARHNLEMEYWKRQAVVVFHRLAKGTPKTKVVMGDKDYKFDVIDAASNEFIAQLSVNNVGEPIKWSTQIGDRMLEHIFGPLHTFDNLSFPIWGATSSGRWRYEHTAISLSDSLPPVSYKPPKIDKD